MRVQSLLLKNLNNASLPPGAQHNVCKLLVVHVCVCAACAYFLSLALAGENDFFYALSHWRVRVCGLLVRPYFCSSSSSVCHVCTHDEGGADGAQVSEAAGPDKNLPSNFIVCKKIVFGYRVAKVDEQGV